MAFILIISIHAAREGGDLITDNKELNQHISIHAAREGGDDMVEQKSSLFCISIHAAREGGDAIRRAAPPVPSDFNPRRP